MISDCIGVRLIQQVASGSQTAMHAIQLAVWILAEL
jgi:hypothetical protein